VRNDLTYLAIMVGFFLLSILFVMACERIIGSDEAALAEAPGGEPEPEPASGERAA
jgi:hypothetical protein